MSDDTYEKPAHGWTCFHCGETFTNAGSAADHFGADPGKQPGCMIRVSLGAERGLLMKLRQTEEELAKVYRERGEEDTHLHRVIYSLQSRHSDALQTAEELGYERGLRAGAGGNVHTLRQVIYAECIALCQGIKDKSNNSLFRSGVEVCAGALRDKLRVWDQRQSDLATRNRLVEQVVNVRIPSREWLEARLDIADDGSIGAGQTAPRKQGDDSCPNC